MRRDFICLTRLIVDSLPKKIRNSYLLFKLAKHIFNLPEILYEFRSNFDKGLYDDLSIFYKKDSPYKLKRTSQYTDINSKHIKQIISLVKKENPKSILDVGCGTGYLVDLIEKENFNKFISVLDYNIPPALKNKSKYKCFEGDILEKLKLFKDDSFELVICTHVLEHIKKPELVLRDLRRISSRNLLIICPLENNFKWGMNYHINFYKDELSFQKFVKSIGYVKEKLLKASNFYKFLGDLMYVETYM
mgnify:CR=1 FL=1|tara:strand:+ start:32695 stop:33435 length:741 start_codon:yes stop_codon:yes gene_type:complete